MGGDYLSGWVGRIEPPFQISPPPGLCQSQKLLRGIVHPEKLHRCCPSLGVHPACRVERKVEGFCPLWRDDLLFCQDFLHGTPPIGFFGQQPPHQAAVPLTNSPPLPTPLSPIPFQNSLSKGSGIFRWICIFVLKRGGESNRRGEITLRTRRTNSYKGLGDHVI